MDPNVTILLFLTLPELEFDSIAVCRGAMMEGTQARRLLSELLLQLTQQQQQQGHQGMKEIANDSKVVVVAATNRIEVCNRIDSFLIVMNS